MRKITQRLTSKTNNYSNSRWHFIWLIALLVFVQQIGKGQTHCPDVQLDVVQSATITGDVLHYCDQDGPSLRKIQLEMDSLGHPADDEFFEWSYLTGAAPDGIKAFTITGSGSCIIANSTVGADSLPVGTHTIRVFQRDSVGTFCAGGQRIFTVVNHPKPNITVRDTTICLNTAVDLRLLVNGTPSEGLLEYRDTSNNAGFGTASSFYIFHGNKIGKFDVIVRDSVESHTCVDRATITVTVENQPSISGRDTCINIGQQVDLSSLISSANGDSIKYFIKGTTDSTSNIQTPNKTTTYIVRSSNTLCYDEVEIEVGVRDIQIINADNVVCDPFKGFITFNLNFSVSKGSGNYILKDLNTADTIARLMGVASTANLVMEVVMVDTMANSPLQLELQDTLFGLVDNMPVINLNLPTCNYDSIFITNIKPTGRIISNTGFQLHDPCSCRNDAVVNTPTSGSFDETIIVKGTTATSDTFTVVSLGIATGGAAARPPVPFYGIGYKKFTPLGDSLYALNIQHFNDAGYSIEVEGPGAPGASGNVTKSIANFCTYPTINFKNVLSSSYPLPNSSSINAAIESATNQPGTAIVKINGVEDTLFVPDALGIGNHVIEANFSGTFVSNQGGLSGSPAYPGCNVSLSHQFSITRTGVSTHFCNCTNTTGANNLPFVDSIIISSMADSISLVDVMFFEPDTRTIVAAAFFEENDITNGLWAAGDTLENAGTNLFKFEGYFFGTKDAMLRFVESSGDTIKVNIPACTSDVDIKIEGIDSVCSAETASFKLNYNVDSVTWTFGGKNSATFTSGLTTYSPNTADTFGLVNLVASGLIKGSCTPFSVSKQIYVQDTAFHIDGNKYACLYDTLDYSLDLKGAIPDYNTIAGLQWSVNGGGKILGDTANVLKIQVMWDSMITPHQVVVTGVTTSGCSFHEVLTVNVDSILKAQITGPLMVCQGSTEGYKSQLAKIDTLQWTTIPDSVAIVTEISEDSVHIQWLMPGTHKIYVSGSADGFACDVVDSSISVTVLDTAFLITGFGAACQADSTGFGLRNLDGSAVNLKNLTWVVTRDADGAIIAPKDTLIIGGNMSGIRDSIDVIWDSIGAHTITVTGETTSGCVISETKSVNVRDMNFRIFGDTTVCFMDTTLYMVYDANDMAVGDMRTINWILKRNDGTTFMTSSDDTVKIEWLVPGMFELIVSGMTEDGCPVSDSLDITVVNSADLKIQGPSKQLGVKEVLWTLNADSDLMNNVQWQLINSTGFPSVSQVTQDSFKMTDYRFFGNLNYDSMNVVVSGNVGTMCSFTDTIPFILRDTAFQIFGDPIVCNLNDSSIYHINVPGIESISWSVDGGSNTIVDTIGMDKDSIAVRWATNGKIRATINTVDGCTITDSLTVFVRESSVILGDTAVCELDTVMYSLKGLTASDTLDFSDLTLINWTYPSSGMGMTTNARMDSIQVIYTNQSGEPFYIDSISVAFMTNDGCIDTIKQYITIREKTYGLMGMNEVCQDGSFNFKFGSFNSTGELIDLPPAIVADLAYVKWKVTPDTSVVSSSGDMATLKFDDTGLKYITVCGTFNDSTKFEFTDSIIVRSKALELHGDTDGFFFDGQTSQFNIMEVNKGVSHPLQLSELDGILWAVEDHGDMGGSTAFANKSTLTGAVLSTTAVAASPLSGTQSNIGQRLSLQLQTAGSFTNAANNEYRGMAHTVNTVFNGAGNNDHLFVGLVTSAGCEFTQTINIAIANNSNSGSIACNNLVNVAMGPDCIFDVEPDLILEDVEPEAFDEYSIRITDSEGNFVSNGRLDRGEVGKTLIVTVTHDGSKNSCWGTIFVEDKNIPTLICGRDTVNCDNDFMDPNATFWNFESAEPRYRGFPIPNTARAVKVAGLVNTYALTDFDFCGSDTLRFFDDDNPLACADGMSRKILRTWTITSRSGFTPIVCVDTILVEKLVIDSIDFRALLPHKSYRCDQKATILKDSFPNPAITGNLDNLKDDPCYQLNAGYTDSKIQLCGESMKFFRHWTVIDWCTTQDTTFIQIISFEDKRSPSVSRPQVFDNISDDHECTNVFSIRRPVFSDCSEITDVRLELKKVNDTDWSTWGTKDNPNEDFTGITFGSEGDLIEARFVLTDACGNMGTSQVSSRITIQDNITPTAVCDEEVVITLNDEGVAFATYRTFNDGSTDNCGIVKHEIRRLTTECDDKQSLQWGPIVGFCCNDLGKDNVQVELRVTDAAGNSNICVAKITAQEVTTKIKAELVPKNDTVSCGTDLSNLNALYGQPLFLASACGQKIEPNEKVVRNIDDCGKGVVTRTWTAESSLGVTLPIILESGQQVTSVRQIITVGKVGEVLVAADIVFPGDIDTFGCISSLNPKVHTYLGNPIFKNAPCSDPIATYTDQIFKNTEGFCAKVIRTWKVIDWCTVDSLDRNNPNGLFFEHVQIIKLHDNIDPEITSGNTDQTLNSNTADCRGFYTFTATGTDDCESDLLKWVYKLDINNNGSIDATGKSNVFDVTLPAGTHKINWILSDGCDNQDEESQLITINVSGCTTNSGNSVTISGKLYTENKFTVDNVNVKLTDAFGTTVGEHMTPVNGEYAFEDITANTTYKVQPIKNDDYRNGVSTLDMLLIQYHILGLKYFESPYKVIAADVNGSSSVSAADVISIRQLVLSITDEFPVKRSWSFVDATLSFDDILSPFPYVGIISMNNLDYSPDNMDFVAVKMGDVNGDLTLASAPQSRSNLTKELTLKNVTIEANKMFSIPLETENALHLAGIQLGLSFDKEKVEFLGLYGNGFEVTTENINESLLKQGEVVMSWYDTEGIRIDENEAVMEFRFAAKASVNVKEIIKLNNEYISSEMYTLDNDAIEVSSVLINNKEESAIGSELTVFQNTPNPFESATDITFSIPNDSYIQLDVYDVSGKSVFHHEDQYTAGENKVTITSEMLAGGGLYIYQIADGNQIVQKKMIYIK